MKKNKKIAALALAASMSLGALAGCAGGELEERPGGITDGFTMTAATDDAGRAFRGMNRTSMSAFFIFCGTGRIKARLRT